MTHSSKVGKTRKTHLKVEVPSEYRADQLLRIIGGRLRALRFARGLTQWAMGERGLSYKYYQRLESGRANMTIRTLERVARALGVPFEELVQTKRR